LGQISLSGAFTAGPPTAGEGTFPGALLNVPLSLTTTPKQYGVATGVLTRLLASPSSFVTLDGVGAAATVTKGDTLYLKSSGSIDLQLTLDDGVGGSTTAVVTGRLFIIEFDTVKFLKLLEAKGSATVEYFVSGQS
jgi:hypothetical protein